MTIDPIPSHALATLSVEHDQLRAMIARCEELSDDHDGHGEGSVEAAQLLRAVAALRQAFDHHNRLEERVLPPLLLDADWSGAVRVSRMVEDHVEEHAALSRELDMTTLGELRRVLASLRAHLDSEERYFLTRRVLRDDLA